MEKQRTDALINGALIALGAAAVFDNIMFHWLLGLHRAIPGPYAGWVEAFLVALGAGLLILGVWREVRVRRTGQAT